MILMLDNYDSFTYNLVQYLQVLQYRVSVFRNNEITIQNILEINPETIIISPGPGRPEDAGITLSVIKNFAGKIPIFGVCLGHQAIAQAFGGNIIAAQEIMHGKTSLVHHQHQGAFKHLQSPFQVTRYHSLVIDPISLPNDFMITAQTRKPDGSFDEIMGIKHKTLALEGVQFHPESILSEHGHQLLSNFIKSNTPKLSSLELAMPLSA